MSHLLDIAPLPSPMPSGCSRCSGSNFDLDDVSADTLRQIQRIVPDSVADSAETLKDSLASILPTAGVPDGGSDPSTMMLVIIAAITAIVLLTVFARSKSPASNRLKTHSLPCILMACLCLPFLTGCNDKAKEEKMPNIDSLVNAKVEERLKEKTESVTKQAEEITEKAEEVDDEDAEEIVDEDEDAGKIPMSGFIGSYPITMYIDNLSEVDEGDYIGYYYYDERPQSKFDLIVVKYEAINTKGSMNLILKEYSPKGAHTGTFNGQYECRGDYYTGTFTNSKGQKFKFKLK